jgi:SAM-dependent methyltransferase
MNAGFLVPGHASVRRGFDLIATDPGLQMAGFDRPEATGRWTYAGEASITLPVPPGDEAAIGIVIELRSFVAGESAPEQRVIVSADGMPVATWLFRDNEFHRHRIEVPRATLNGRQAVILGFEMPDCRQPSALGINSDGRKLGVMIRRIGIGPADPALDWMAAHLGRRVGGEASKCFDRRLKEGFWSRFLTGANVLDVGFRGHTDGAVPIVEGAIGVDLDYPGYDGRTLPFADGSQDAVFSSHCLEHIPDHLNALRDWFRVLRVGGHMIVAVPHAHLYERRRRPPSQWNQDHKRFYTPAALLAEVETALRPNTYRVRLLEENDEGYAYDTPPDQHATGCYEIMLVLQKIVPPAWQIED